MPTTAAEAQEERSTCTADARQQGGAGPLSDAAAAEAAVAMADAIDAAGAAADTERAIADALRMKELRRTSRQAASEPSPAPGARTLDSAHGAPQPASDLAEERLRRKELRRISRQAAADQDQDQEPGPSGGGQSAAGQDLPPTAHAKAKAVREKLRMERGEGLARVEDDEIEEIMLDAPCDVFEVDLYSVDVDVLLRQHAEAEEKFKEDHERLKENRRTSRQAADYGHDAAKPATPGSASESPRRAATPPSSSKISALREKFRAQRSAASPSAPTQAAHALTPEPSSPPRRPGESPPPPQFGAADQPRRRESGGSRGHDTAGADMSGAMADPEEDARAMADVNAPGMSDDDALIAAAAAMMDGGRVQDSPSAHRDGRDEGSGGFCGAAAAGIGKDGRAVKPRFTGIGANSRRCPVVCEILDGRTQRTIAGNPSLRGAADWMQSNQMVSQILAMVAEDRDVKCVLDELLGPTGASFSLLPAAALVHAGEPQPWVVLAERAVTERGVVLCGYQERRRDGGAGGAVRTGHARRQAEAGDAPVTAAPVTVINPRDKTTVRSWDGIALIVLTGRMVHTDGRQAVEVPDFVLAPPHPKEPPTQDWMETQFREIRGAVDELAAEQVGR
jgi:hypothetical protein